MINKLIQNKYFPVLLFFFAFGLYCVNNWNTNIYILDEAKNSECAREMLEQEDLLIPTFNYNLRKDKPPLHYFFMMASYKIFGVNEWAARFFSAIFGALTILITFLYTKKFINRKTAFFAVLVLLSSIHLSIQFHLAVPDPYLIFFFCWSLFLFYSAVTTKKKPDVFLMYISIGLAILTKGPMAIALPGLIFLLFLIFTKQLKWIVIKRLNPFLGALIVLLIVLPWFILNGLETNWEWTREFLLKHNFSRFGSEMEGHGGIFLITFLYVFIGLMPFSVLIFPAIKTALKNKKDSFILFCLTAAGVIVVFFSISQTKLPNYTVPSYPFLAIILAYYLKELKPESSGIKPWIFGLLIISLIVPVGGYFALKTDQSLADAAGSGLWFVILPVGVFISLAFLYKKQIAYTISTIAGTFILASILFFVAIFPAIDKQNPVKKSIHLLQDKEVAYYKKFNASYSFYLKKKIPELDADQIETFFQENPDGILISIQKQIDQIELPEGCKIIFSGKDILEIPTTVLISERN
ncbi:MAG: glycosyltransferase family 39 protein [Prolixibacteraceae bacterium]|nr:glycosyltransferase family 39 protein [Prolixibacteraceae bacterium]